MKPLTNYLDQNRLRRFLNLLAILAAFAINVLANIAPLNGQTIGKISNTVFQDVLITPANYAFAIWGLIYLGLISLGVYQLRSRRQQDSLRKIGYLLVWASLAQIAWVIVFQYQLFTLSLLAMLAILLPLIGIYLRLEIGLRSVSRAEKWLIQVPLSIYLAWISVATIVNVATTLFALGWNGWGINPAVWSAIALCTAGAIAAKIGIQRADLAFVLVIVWAFIAIAVRQANIPLIALTSAGLALALILLIIFNLSRRNKFRSSSS